MKILINTVGFIGDNLFASSVAKKLKQQQDCEVDFKLSLPQPFELLSLNPYIDNVYLEKSNKQYDIEYNLKPIHRKLTPCEQFQIQCDVREYSPEFEI